MPGSSQPSSSSLLHKFRSDRKRLPLHPMEKAVLTVVAVHLCFLPWALGTMHVWSQVTSLVLSALSFVLALIPRTYSGDYALPVAGHQSPVNSPTSGNNPQVSGFKFQASPHATYYRLSPLPRLLKFPLFWIGLALLAYIAVQGFNPSWVWERNATTWWLRRVNDIPWLPTSIDTPFERFNLWRQFIIYASAWLTVCTVWVGFTRRHSLQILLVALVVNAAVLAGVGFFQNFSGLDSYLFLMKWPVGHTAFASFIYHNHAGAYFALLTFLALALAIWFNAHGTRSGKKSSPAGLLVFVALLLTAAVFFSLSRGASLIISGTWAVAGIWFWLYRRRQPVSQTMNPVITTAVVLLFVTVVGGTIRYLDFSSVERRFHSLFTNYRSPDESVRSRLLAHESAQVMLSEHWPRGVGAGGFRYLYPEYIRDKPEIYAGGRFFWEHAHCDWLEIPIELGATGCLLVLLAGGYWLMFFFGSGRYSVSAFSRTATQVSGFRSQPSIFWHSLAGPVLLGCGQPLIHAWFDFPFQCPAILITWLGLIVMSARWAELDV